MAKKKKSGSAQPQQPPPMKRGPTALVKNRGTGFEGELRKSRELKELREGESDISMAN